MSERCYKTVIGSAVGPLTAVATDRGLCGLEFDLPKRASMLASRLKRWYRLDDAPSPHSEQAAKTFAVTEAWLAAYFAGREPSDLPALDARGSQFEMAVWKALLEIPFGATESYGALAARLGRPRGARAIGLGVGRNPIGIIVPCHRVVGSNGALTGYGGGLARKKWLLTHESQAAPCQLELELVRA